MTSPIPITRDLVLLGGGHTHALVLRKWAMQPLHGVQISLINPGVKAPYTGMLPGFVAGHYQRHELDIDLVRLARQAGARLIVDRAIGIDTDRQMVQLESRPEIAYDTLSVDIGITSFRPSVSDENRTILPAKPLGPFADSWATLVERVTTQAFAARIAIIGAGVAGVELALSMAYRLRKLGHPAKSIQLIEASPAPMRELNASARRNLRAELEKAGIEVCLQQTADTLPADIDFVVSAAGARPQAWLAETSLALENGYICVDKHLKSINTPNVFAAGDCAHLTHAPRPKAGVFAVRQAPVLFHNLQAELSGGALRSYTPQRDYLKLISKGRRSAVSDKWGIGVSGQWVWKWKDRIDQAFMLPFRQPIEMPAPGLPQNLATGVRSLFEQQQKACGACGAKVGQSALMSGLNNGKLETPHDDAVITKTESGYEVFSTDHLRAFNADPFILAKVAAIHALGDIWAMGALPNTVLANIILPPLAPQKQSAMIAEITSAANSVFALCDTQISGGHTSNGAELTIGFSISGATSRPPIRQNGARDGDVLVLTKPIGTGLILAAEMQQAVDGDMYLAALEQMLHPQHTASRLLASVATAMTDVTGFGLAGHVINILDASDIAANIDLDLVPLLTGTAHLNEIGLRSTLFPENARLRSRIESALGDRMDVLFDPQTSGGLLASVPAHIVSDLCAAFAAEGESIWQIGHILDGPPKLSVT